MGRHALARPLFSLVLFSLNANKPGVVLAGGGEVAEPLPQAPHFRPHAGRVSAWLHTRLKELVPPRWD